MVAQETETLEKERRRRFHVWNKASETLTVREMEMKIRVIGME